MAQDQDDGQEKTEEPTEKRKQDSLKDGQVLASKELLTSSSLLTGALIFFFAGHLFYKSMMELMQSSFRFEDILSRGIPLQTVFFTTFFKASLIVILFAFPILINAFLAQSAFGGIHFIKKSFSFRISRLNPISGLKRIFGLNALVEMVKSLLKIIVTGSFACFFIYYTLDDILALFRLNFEDSTIFSGKKVVFLFLIMALGTIFVSLLDIVYQIYKHNKSLRMSFQQVKDESKDTQTSPEVRSKIRQMQMEMAGNRSGESIDSANVVLINPTHFSVALKYIPSEDNAPVVLAKATGQSALNMRKEADSLGIPLLRQPDLTRAIYFSSESGGQINEELYQAVAVVFSHVFRDMQDNLPMVKVPKDMLFDEQGRQVKA